MPRTAHEKDGNVASIQTLERRILALEARLADLEGGYGETMYQLRPESIGNRIEIGHILTQMNLPRATDEQIDAVLDQ